MKQTEVIEFFDKMAPEWDNGIVRNDDAISAILDNARVKKGSAVLDVACGTGVLIPDYIARGAESITGIDISPEMLVIAKKKFQGLEFICADAEKYDFKRQFDNIVIFNAFPHFPNPEGLIAHLSEYLKVGGTLTVAHDKSRQAINNHHKGAASGVSIGLLPSEDLAKIFSAYLDVIINISDDTMYQVTGVKS